MKHAFFAAALIIASSVAFADATSVLLDRDKVRSMSAEEFAAAVRSAPDVNARDKKGWTALHIAAFGGTSDNIAALLEAGSDVNARTTAKGFTPLHIAAGFGTRYPEMITALLNAGANVEARDKNGWTALRFAAAAGGTLETITALLSVGADVNARDKKGWTALHAVAAKGTPETIIALLEAGASGSVKSKNGKTPFDLAEDNDKVKETAAYWALNDAQYK